MSVDWPAVTPASAALCGLGDMGVDLGACSPVRAAEVRRPGLSARDGPPPWAQSYNLTKVGTSPLQRTNGDGSRWRLSAGGATCRRTAAASAWTGQGINSRIFLSLAFRLKHLNIKVTFCAVLRVTETGFRCSFEVKWNIFCARNYMLKVFKERNVHLVLKCLNEMPGLKNPTIRRRRGDARSSFKSRTPQERSYAECIACIVTAPQFGPGCCCCSTRSVQLQWRHLKGGTWKVAPLGMRHLWCPHYTVIQLRFKTCQKW